MSNRRSALGRGLGALITNSDPAPPPPPRREAAEAAVSPSSAPSLRQIPVDRIDPNPEQPRRHFSSEQLERLASSILQHGVLQPVVVRRVGDRYELIVGERRWRATRAAGLKTIPAVTADAATADRLELAIVENVQRHDLNPIELAHAYRALADAGATQEEIGAKVAMDRSSVANHLRLLELPRNIQEDVESGRLSMGHAKALLQVSNPERRQHLRDRAIGEGLSVRSTELLGRQIAGPAPRARKRRSQSDSIVDPDLAQLLENLQQRLQTRVQLKGGGNRGRIEIEYFDGEDLERIAALLLGQA